MIQRDGISLSLFTLKISQDDLRFIHSMLWGVSSCYHHFAGPQYNMKAITVLLIIAGLLPSMAFTAPQPFSHSRPAPTQMAKQAQAPKQQETKREKPKSRKRDHEYELCFYNQYGSQKTITVESTPDHLLRIKGSNEDEGEIDSQMHYDVTNIDGAAAYIVGIYKFNSKTKVELIHKESSSVIARWDFNSFSYGSGSEGIRLTKAIQSVKSILKSLQVRE